VPGLVVDKLKQDQLQLTRVEDAPPAPAAAKAPAASRSIATIPMAAEASTETAPAKPFGSALPFVMISVYMKSHVSHSLMSHDAL
jgi:hypothetical protein